MARTKASVGAKISSGKSSKARCTVAPTPSSSSSGSSDRSAKSSSGGGNPVCPRETPKWQRPITNFFINKSGRNDSDSASEDEQSASSSKPKPRRNLIESDNEDEINVEKPKNTELDETIDLEPLDGEDSHKISEYYPKNNLTSNGDVYGKENEVTEVKDDVYEKIGDVNGNKDDVTENKGDVNGNKDVNAPDSDANSNKVEKKVKGKGVGKKTKINKENVSDNVERRNSIKRDLEDGSLDVEHASKKIKV